MELQENMTPAGEIISGYKMTNEDMTCMDFKYELGVWYEHEGEIELCEQGFHFCEYPSGPWSYYNDGRMFKCEAEFVIKSVGPGADLKHVAKRIRLIEEIIITGDCNRGNWNTGNWNTGNCNTGDRNTGNRNTGNCNTGDCNRGNWNTGNWNTGNWNTGNWNTGNWNTGDWNTGNWNTGNCNTGDRNTGNCNTGNCNTGDGNVGNFHSGSLNYKEAPIYLFDKKVNISREYIPWGLVNALSALLMKDEEIDPTPFLSIPNASVKNIKKLHEAHIAARKQNK